MMDRTLANTISTGSCWVRVLVFAALAMWLGANL
jgi:hypothetical protein